MTSAGPSSPARATIGVSGLAGRTLTVLDEGRQVPAKGDTLTDTFARLGVHLYVAPPTG